MKLMGVGSIEETQSDMVLCDAIALETAARGGGGGGGGGIASPRGGAGDARGHGRGDVLITNPLPSSVHILTVDYLFTLAPCQLRMAAGELEAFARGGRGAGGHAPPARYAAAPLRLVGGAPVVDVVVGDATFACTLDTGAPGGVSLGAGAAARLRACRRAPADVGGGGLSLRQHGVNGESVCSTVVESDDVLIQGVRLPPGVPILINDAAVDHTDGYVGMACLRALDVWLSHTHLGVAPSGLPVRRAAAFPTTPRACEAGPRVACAGDAAS